MSSTSVVDVLFQRGKERGRTSEPQMSEFEIAVLVVRFKPPSFYCSFNSFSTTAITIACADEIVHVCCRTGEEVMATVVVLFATGGGKRMG